MEKGEYMESSQASAARIDPAAERNIRQHIKILGVMFIVWGALSVLFGIGFFLFLVGIGTATGDGQVIAILSIVATVIGSLCLITGIPEIITGWALLEHKSWSRWLTIVMAILNLLDMPFGTALGIYALWVLFKPESESILTE